MTKASSVEQLQACESLSDLARLIGFTPKGLSFVIHTLPKADRYRTFEIPKKSGGTRTISAPDPRLALAQRRLARLLYQCWHELSLKKANPRPLSHGFHKKLSIVTNAREHRNRRYVLNLDLQDFFGTINFGRVRGFFIGDNRFSLKPDVATVAAQIACHDNSLPQGSPSSPVISNLIGHILDIRLARFAKKHRLHYSRYVDDITFSTNEKVVPSDVAVRIDESREWQLGQALRDTIARAGFEINDSKTRMQIKGSRQVATGLVVNSKVNVASEYYRETRAMCDALFRTGAYHRPNEPDTTLNSLAPLEGRLAHILYVRRRRDLDRRETASAQKSGSPLQHEGIDNLYRRFLIYKHFAAPRRPILITEGKTDIVYLSCALKSLANNYPDLQSSGPLPDQRAIAFVPDSYVSEKVLGLLGGYSDMVKLIATYKKVLRRYRHAPMSHPAILVVDNDEGGEKVFKRAKNSADGAVGYETSPIWHHLELNLYVLRTPPKQNAASPKDAKTSMEDLFPASVLGTVLDGKPFDAKKPHGDTTAYGKAIFADQVVRPQRKSIDFSAFGPMFEAVRAIIAHHNATHSTSSGQDTPDSATA